MLETLRDRGAVEGARTLYYVPMIHTAQELGELGPAIKDIKETVYGEKAARADEREIEHLWHFIRWRVFETVPNVPGLIIYQDGLPVGPREKIRALFALTLADYPASPLFRLMKELIDRGAILEGTEDIALVRKRIQVCQEISRLLIRYQNPKDVEKFITQKMTEHDDLIKRADQFIANRINETLPPQARGLLFMGLHHRVDEEIRRQQDAGLLSSPIEVIHILKLEIEKRDPNY